MYSAKDKFSRGVAILVYMPLLLPYFLINEIGSYAVSIALLIGWLWVVVSNYKIYEFLFMEGEKGKRFIILTMITTGVNFLLSFVIKNQVWLLIIISFWSFYLSVFGVRGMLKSNEIHSQLEKYYS